MVDINLLRSENARRWQNARLTWDFQPVAKRLVAAKIKYQSVSYQTGVPWTFIAVVHEREASQRWDTQLGQGDPLDRVSIHVPKGRGPFKTWEDGAIDALNNCAPYAGRNKDWTIGGLLTKLEEYNGLGYASRGVPSPYVWSGTDQYRSGKYVRDGVYDPNAVDSQLGCAGLLIAMMALDPSIVFDTKMPASMALTQASKPHAPDISKPRPPSLTNPAKGSIGGFIATILSAIWRKK